MNDLSLERWQQIDALFATVLEYPPEEQLSFLKQACANDLALYEEVRALLDSEGAAADMLGESATQYASPLITDIEQDLAATFASQPTLLSQVGPYRIIKEIAHGGMGRVYLAQRSDGLFEKQVALKIIQRGLTSDELLSRFHYERQILAALEHPNIARLYDGGTTDDGRPYFVMEYVEGRSVTDYCDEHRLSTRQRLALFRTVCRAVQYAHQNLIVHRDLKPSNILVTDDGQVKLLDFGIAKLLSEESAEDGMPQTQTGQRLMTPEYAAPEQIRGEVITTATDVYQLGVLLYELLTGRRPYRVKSRVQYDIERIILEEEPTRPSTAVAQVEEAIEGSALSAETVSKARSTSVEALERRLRGDLDVIVLKALRKEQDRRYGSAEQLSEDLRRHLVGLPVSARPETVRYRAQKFVQRHRFGVVTLAGFVVLAAAFTLLYTVRITQERDRAQAEADKAQAATAFMESLFEGADPNEALGDTLNVFELLGRGTQHVEALAAQPEIQATVQHTLGTLHLKLGDYQQAEPLLMQALQTREALYRDVHVETIQSLQSLAQVNHKRGTYETADSLFQIALTRQRALVGDAHRDVALVLNEYGNHLSYTNQYAKAKPVLQEALIILESLPTDQDEAIAEAQSSLGAVLMNEANYEEAEPLLRQALETRRKRYGDVHTEISAALDDLGNLLVDTERYDEAEATLSEGLDIRRKLLGNDHPEVSLALNNLSLVYYYKGDYKTAEAMMREAVEIKEKILGREHRDIGMTLNNIAWVVMAQDDLAKAENVFRESLAIMQAHSGPVSADAALLLGNMGVVLENQQKYAEAEPYFREAVAVRRQVHGDENMHVAWRQHALAELLRKLARYDEAEQIHRESVALRRKLRAPEHADVGWGLLALGGTLVDQKEFSQAEPILREALTIYQNLDGQPANVARAQSLLGVCLTAQEAFPEAEKALLESYEWMRENFGDQDEETLTAKLRLQELYLAWGQPEKAAAYEV